MIDVAFCERAREREGEPRTESREGKKLGARGVCSCWERNYVGGVREVANWVVWVMAV